MLFLFCCLSQVSTFGAFCFPHGPWAIHISTFQGRAELDQQWVCIGSDRNPPLLVITCTLQHFPPLRLGPICPFLVALNILNLTRYMTSHHTTLVGPARDPAVIASRIARMGHA